MENMENLRIACNGDLVYDDSSNITLRKVDRKETPFAKVFIETCLENVEELKWQSVDQIGPYDHWLPKEEQITAGVITFTKKNLKLDTAFKYRIRRRNAWAWSDYTYFTNVNPSADLGAVDNVLLTPILIEQTGIQLATTVTTTIIEEGTYKGDVKITWQASQEADDRLFILNVERTAKQIDITDCSEYIYDPQNA